MSNQFISCCSSVQTLHGDMTPRTNQMNGDIPASIPLIPVRGNIQYEVTGTEKYIITCITSDYPTYHTGLSEYLQECRHSTIVVALMR